MALKFDVYVENNNDPFHYDAGYAFGRGTCKGGFTNCSGVYVPSSVDAAKKDFVWQLWTTQEIAVYWIITEKFSRVENCLMNPEWYQETTWTTSYETGWSWVYCN